MNLALKIGAIIAVFVGVFGITWVVYFPHSPLGKQNTNLKLATLHEPAVRSALRNLKGAERLQVGIYTGLDGSLAVTGKVQDNEMAQRVMAKVLATKPPVTIWFNLVVGETNVIQQIVQPHATPNADQQPWR